MKLSVAIQKLEKILSGSKYNVNFAKAFSHLKLDKYFNRLDRILIRTATSVLLLCLLIYFTGFSPTRFFLGPEDGGTGQEVGNLGAFEGSVKRIAVGGTELETVKLGAIFYDNDTVMTGSQSHARVTLYNGGTIDLDPDSMVRLSFSSRFGLMEIMRTTVVDVIAGNVRGETRHGKIMLRSQGKTMMISKDHKDTLVVVRPVAVAAAVIPSKPLPAEDFPVAMVAASAASNAALDPGLNTVLPRSVRAPPMDPLAGPQAAAPSPVPAPLAPAPKVKSAAIETGIPAALSPTYPPSGATLSARGEKLGKEGILFTWKKDPNYKNYQVEITQDSTFAKVDYTKKSQDHLIVIAKILPGAYWWRVLGVSAQGKKSAPGKTYQLNVVK